MPGAKGRALKQGAEACRLRGKERISNGDHGVPAIGGIIPRDHGVPTIGIRATAFLVSQPFRAVGAAAIIVVVAFVCVSAFHLLAFFSNPFPIFQRIGLNQYRL